MSSRPLHPLGRTGLNVSRIGWGTVKIGRNQAVKYPNAFNLPDQAAVNRLVAGLIDAGIHLIDTAPAYGSSETRLGQALLHTRQRDQFVLCTKVGEDFIDGISHYDFSAQATYDSIDRSLQRLQTDVLDVVHIHSDGNDVENQQAGCVEALQRCQEQGKVRAIGLSGKTAAGFELAAQWADSAMVEFSVSQPQLGPCIETLAAAGVGVIVKKALGSGHLDAREALGYVFAHPGVTSAVIGSLNLDHLQENVNYAS